MQKIIYAFVGTDFSFNSPFSFGDDHLEAFNGYIKEYESHTDKKLFKSKWTALKKRLVYGYIVYDTDTKQYSVVNKMDAVSIADNANQLYSMFLKLPKPKKLEYDMFNLCSKSITTIGDIISLRMRSWFGYRNNKPFERLMTDLGLTI